jgi:tetrahydromethanopterin S-methyltransferase subunit E
VRYRHVNIILCFSRNKSKGNEIINSKKGILNCMDFDLFFARFQYSSVCFCFLVRFDSFEFVLFSGVFVFDGDLVVFGGNF